MLGFEARNGIRNNKMRRKKELSLEELEEIMRCICKEGRTQCEVGHLFAVKPQLIRNLVRNENQNKNSISQLKEKRKAKVDRRQQIKDCVNSHIRGNWHIWTTQQIREALVQKDGPDVKNEEVRRVLREDFNMSYRLLKRAAY